MVNNTWRIIFAVAALLFDASVIWWTLIYGNATNVLHASALSWAWFSGFVILGGIGVSTVSSQLVDALSGAVKKP